MDTDKTGWKTSEFWLTVAAIVASSIVYLLGSLIDEGVFPEGSQGAAIAAAILKVSTMAVTALAALGYSVARSTLKAKVASARMAAEATVAAEKERTGREITLKQISSGDPGSP